MDKNKVVTTFKPKLTTSAEPDVPTAIVGVEVDAIMAPITGEAAWLEANVLLCLRWLDKVDPEIVARVAKREGINLAVLAGL